MQIHEEARNLAWLGTLLCLAWVMPSHAAVVVDCGGPGSDFHGDCSLQELLDGGSIEIHGVTFDSFTWSSTLLEGSLGSLTRVRVFPVDSPSRPGLSFSAGRVWSRRARTIAFNELSFRIRNRRPAPFLGRRLYAGFGSITGVDPSLGEESAVQIQDNAFVTASPPPGGPDMTATVQCFASNPRPCSWFPRRDSHAGAPPADDFVPSNDMMAKIAINIIAVANGAAELDYFRYQIQLPNLLDMAIVPDMNGNGIAEIAVITEDRNRANSIAVQVRGGLGGQLLGRRSFLNNRYKPVGLAGLPDLDGNSVPELALLAVRDSDDQVVVEIRNASGPSSPRQVTLSPGHVPIGLKALPGDTDGNGIPELAVLSSRVADGQESIDIFNVFGEPNLRTVVYDPVQLDVLDFVTVDDGNGDGSVEIAALAKRAGDGLYVVDIRELSGQDSPAITRSLRANHRPRAITTVTDANGNGIPELVVLQEDVTTGVTRVEVRDELGADNPRLFNYAGGAAVRPLQLVPLPDTDGDSVPEFALLIDHRQTSAANVIVNNASGPGSARTLRFEPGRRSEPISFALLGDADGNGIQDLSLLQDLGGVVGAEMRNLNGQGSPWYIRFD